jgi:hypothetical protein
VADRKVCILDPHTSQPLKGIVVEARAASDGSFISTARTNDQGIASFSLTVAATFHARTANTPPLYQIVIPIDQSWGPFWFNYLVDPAWAAIVASGEGSEGQSVKTPHGFTFNVYSTLAGATAAAITSASTNGEKTILVVSSITEGEIDIGGLGTGASIIITAADRYAVVITATSNNDIFDQDSAGGGDAGRLVFRNIGLAPASGKAVLDINTGGNEVRILAFESCDFPAVPGRAYLVRQDGSDGMGRIKLRVRHCTGGLAGFYQVGGNLVTLAIDSLEAFDNKLTMTAWWDGDSVNATPTESARVQGGFYTVDNGITTPADGPDEFHWSDLLINFGGDEALFTSPAASDTGNDWSFRNIVLRTTHVDSAFLNLGGGTAQAPHDNIYIHGIFGYSTVSPTGTFITVDLDLTNVYVSDIHAPEWAIEYSGPTMTPVVPINASTVELPHIGSPTYDDVEDANTLFGSAGWFSGGQVTDNEDGTVTIAAGQGVLRASASATATLKFIEWPELADQPIDAGTTKWIGVELNDPNDPQAVVRDSDDLDHFTDFELAVVVRESVADGGDIHIAQHEHHAGDTSHTIIERFHETMHIARDNMGGGLILSDEGSNDIKVTAGGLWTALDRFAISEVDTAGAGTFDEYSSQGKENAGIGAWPDTLYDNGSGGVGSLQTAGNNKWLNLWWYMELDGDLVMVYGSNHYATEAQAENETLPTSVPGRITAHGIFIGRFIFKEGTGTVSQVLSAFTAVPGDVAGVTDHGNLVGLADPDHHSIGDAGNPLVLADSGLLKITWAGEDDYVQFSTTGFTQESDGAALQYQLRHYRAIPGLAFNLNTARGDIDTPAALQSGDLVGGEFHFKGHTGSGFVDGAVIRGIARENFSAGPNVAGTDLDFLITPLGGASEVLMARMREDYLMIDIINDLTADVGVTVDGLLIKDGDAPAITSFIIAMS